MEGSRKVNFVDSLCLFCVTLGSHTSSCHISTAAVAMSTPGVPRVRSAQLSLLVSLNRSLVRSSKWFVCCVPVGKDVND